MKKMQESGLAAVLVVVLASVGFSRVGARNFHFYNNCPFPVWAGALNNPGFQLPSNGGWRMDHGASKDVGLQDDWQGRFWGRTSCDGSGHCETGDCGNRIECAGAGGVPPATLAEFTLAGHAGLDFYDVSLVDGYNLPLLVTPRGGQGACKSTGCRKDLNAICPGDLRINNKDGWPVACQSGCTKYQRDDYCCRGSHSTPQTCPPPDYTRFFKDACPTAYSYAYDDLRGTFTCTGANYDITFCP